MHEDDKQPEILTTISEEGFAAFYYPGEVDPFVEIGVEKPHSGNPAMAPLDTIVVMEDGEEICRVPFGSSLERAAVMSALGFCRQSEDWTPLEPDVEHISPNISAIRR